jgi:hypothetical protein
VTNNVPWHRLFPKITDKTQLPSVIPTPMTDQGHVLPYKTDDWGLIRRVEELGGRAAVYEAKCAGCGAKTRLMVNDTALFDPTIYWLCEDCLDSGFRWASTLTQDDTIFYQMVRQLPNDSLMRHLKYSDNPRDVIHRPIDSVEKLAQSLTKGQKPELKDKR